ncbi:MAG TPA: sodium/solute symporter [Sedimentisphaerales bacterium]|nr:sodium/solute symporter [Sedimentisphaerales bacterium]
MSRGEPSVSINRCFVLWVCLALLAGASAWAGEMLRWEELPALPDTPGLGGPLVGVHNDALIVAGGAYFPEPVWESEKLWRDEAWVLVASGAGGYEWLAGFKLDRPIAYAACVSTPYGVACLGGTDGQTVFDHCFLLRCDPLVRWVSQEPLPPLPEPCAYGAAARIGDVIYLAGGQRGSAFDTATSNFWRLDLSRQGGPAESFRWEALPSWPGPGRAFHLMVAQHNGFDDCIYVVGGRCVNDPNRVADAAGFAPTPDVFALREAYEFDPQRYDAAAFDARSGTYTGTGRFAQPWRRRADVPHAVMAGTGAAIGQSHIFVLSGDDGALMARTDELELEHPGFPKRVLAYHTITDTWIEAGASPANQVTTPAVVWGGKVILASGETKPRVRTPAVWAVEAVAHKRSFGAVNYAVLAVYLLAMVGVGVYFARRNRDTNDYFRGGQKVVWWAAGCSIFATMLSSITYMAIPAKAYAQDLVYLVGNLMIPAVAPVAIYLALPFFRQIDATSAYEYLQKRFNMPVRLFASGSFTLFHVFRMGIVMSLASLALASVTSLSSTQCVLIMGLLCVVYCTIGGIEAVIWTDTIQTFVLLGGALVCLGLMVTGSEGGIAAFFDTAAADGKLHAFNWHMDPTSASLALWVVILGGFGQHLSSYTADQAVVQRYMTTPDMKRAAGSIWAAALMTIPSSFLFFGMGTALYVFYKSHPERLDPTFMTDQVFPLFIAREIPVGLAGLIVAGIFAAAQSTISTSMNSTATAVVTDFLRPFRAVRTEQGALAWARMLTFGFGAAGTALGLLFIDPANRSLFDSFIKVIGLFMGVLGGLFALGVLTRRAGGWGSLLGALAGAGVMAMLPVYTAVNGYLFAAIGLVTCFMVGYGASLLLPSESHCLDGLTIHTMQRR